MKKVAVCIKKGDRLSAFLPEDKSQVMATASENAKRDRWSDRVAIHAVTDDGRIATWIGDAGEIVEVHN